VDLTGAFTELSEAVQTARRYADELSALLGLPAFTLYDLLRTDSTKYIC
jgi:hypothetical protein